MMISGPRNLHYDSVLFMDSEIVKIGQFPGPEIISKWWFLGPEHFIMALAQFWPQISSKWDYFWPQKSSIWPIDPISEAHRFKINIPKWWHGTSMVTLCYPYGPSITCVCHPRGQPVYSCIPTHSGGGGNLGRWKKNIRLHREDLNTEIILAVALLMAVLALFIR